MSEFRFDCGLCDATVRAATEETMKERGTAHLRDGHGGELAELFAGNYAGESCGNDCGYTFPIGVDEMAGFDCPECGHDHRSSFVRRYLYWRIERTAETTE